jgi:predicted ATPase
MTYNRKTFDSLVTWAINEDTRFIPIKGRYLSLNEALATQGTSAKSLIYECKEGKSFVVYEWIDTTWKAVEVKSKPSAVEVADIKLSKCQEKAWKKLQVWVTNKEPYFILRGYPGTGKTFLLKRLKELKESKDFIYTATTNKAAKNLSVLVSLPTKTIYSVLGLRMEQQEDKLVLTQGKSPTYFSRSTLLVVDEAGTAPDVLADAIEEVVDENRLKVILIGDPAQLPPVGQKRSRVWQLTDKVENRALLKTVVRYDNQILSLAIKIRECMKEKNWVSPIEDDNYNNEGVFKYSSRSIFIDKLLDYVDIDNINECKVVAWRNKTVDHYNAMIRKHLGFESKFCKGEQLLLSKPLKTSEGVIIAHIDDEFRVDSVNKSVLEVLDEEIKVYSLYTTQVDTGLKFVLQVPINEIRIMEIMNDLATKARTAFDKRAAWKLFWEVNDKFSKVRYGYALTVHRLQGSTLTDVWVDQEDILANTEKLESFKCLHVACTRPTKRIFTY